MAGIVGLTELQHTNATSAMTIDASGNLTIKTGTTTVKGEGTATTNLQQGLIKSWVNLEQVGTHATRDSFNISSLTDEAVGKTHPITFTNNMSSINYSGSLYTNAYVGLPHTQFDNRYAGGFGSRTTSGHSIVSYGGGAVDADNVQVASWGDLA